MGHHTFTLGDASLTMHDSDVELVRHFLMQAAAELQRNELRDAIQKWECWGPGVWGQIDEKVLIGEATLFARALICVGDQHGAVAAKIRALAKLVAAANS